MGPLTIVDLYAASEDGIGFSHHGADPMPRCRADAQEITRILLSFIAGMSFGEETITEIA